MDIEVKNNTDSEGNETDQGKMEVKRLSQRIIIEGVTGNDDGRLGQKVGKRWINRRPYSR